MQLSTENKSNLINECAKKSIKLKNVNDCYTKKESSKKVLNKFCETTKNDLGKSYSNTLALNNGANSKQGFMFVFSLIILFLSAIMLVIGVTSSQLFAQKSATGTIAFDVSGAPPLIVNNNLNLFYDNTNGLTYGNSASAGSAISGLSAYNLGISENAKAQDYYIKVEYEFDSAIPQGITFGTSTYTSNGIVMSAMTQESGTNKFVSQSSAVQRGASLDILGYLQTFAYSGQDFTLSATDFTITITVDSTNTFNSIFKNSLTYYGKIGFSYSSYVEPTITFDDGINNLSFRMCLGGEKSVKLNGNDITNFNVYFGGTDTRWKIIIYDRFIYSVNDNYGLFNYYSTSSSITITSNEIITNSTLNLVDILTNMPSNVVPLNYSNHSCNIEFLYEKDGQFVNAFTTTWQLSSDHDWDSN